MESHIDEHTAETNLKQIMDLAANNHQRFVVERGEDPAIVIMSVEEYIRSVAPAPEWLQQAWKGAAERGIDTMTMDEIDAEIAEYRREKALASEHEAG